MAESAGFIGLGHMGAPMARNLMKNQMKVYVYNRTKEKAAPLLKEGAQFVESPKEMFSRSKIVFSMVSDDDALQQITVGPEGILHNAKPGSIHVSMSTVSPTMIHDLEIEHTKKGAALLSAPVFGRPEAAGQQKLWICLAGEAEAKKKITPLLLSMGQKIFDFGELPEKANVVKIAGNFLILSNVELLAEVFAFLQKNESDPLSFHTFISETLFSSPIVKGYGKRILDRDFQEVGFRMDLGLKDLQLVLTSAGDVKVPMPMANLLRDRLLTGIAKGRQHLDWSAISSLPFEDAGLS
jgi:3-hydroxyisobutyrate dehydrogenase-like beta-hydroxyacid dehydrogenase